MGTLGGTESRSSGTDLLDGHGVSGVATTNSTWKPLKSTVVTLEGSRGFIPFNGGARRLQRLQSHANRSRAELDLPGQSKSLFWFATCRRFVSASTYRRPPVWSDRPRRNPFISARWPSCL
ncbi:hypothetical protein VTI74DRAFT_5807 [Chaetomium olivicolor]